MSEDNGRNLFIHIVDRRLASGTEMMMTMMIMMTLCLPICLPTYLPRHRCRQTPLTKTEHASKPQKT